jgi:two-component system NtrC family sensor kinase
MHLGASLPTIKGDPVQIEQVVINLVTNACQALRRDDGAITISTAAGENRNVVEVIVEDNGIGIDEEEIPRLIDPFYSTKSETGGTGLGLSVSNYIVTRHNGTMTITSIVGKGTRVKLTFPGAGPA